MQVFAAFAAAVLAVLAECAFEQAKIVGFGPEIADVAALLAGLADGGIHFRPRVTVETVTFNNGRNRIQLLENFTESLTGGSGTGSAGAGNGDNRVGP